MNSDTCSFQQAFECMQHRTGVVIPVYFPEGIDRAQGAALLRDNVGLYLRRLASWLWVKFSCSRR